jgi:hypothetical protein
MIESDGDSDGWATEELPTLTHFTTTTAGAPTSSVEGVDDEVWESQLTSREQEAKGNAAAELKVGEEPKAMIIVDMTMLSDNEIHSKFDANSVNDPVAVKRLRLNIESNYETYAKSQRFLADGTVIPCGSSVWRSALARLRQERPGHYFCPIFQ